MGKTQQGQINYGNAQMSTLLERTNKKNKQILRVNTKLPTHVICYFVGLKLLLWMSPQMSSNAEFPPERCFIRLYFSRLQLLLVCGSFCHQFCFQWVKSRLNWVDVRWLMSLLREAPLLLSLYVLGHYPSVLWSTILSVLQHLAESEQILKPNTPQNSPCCFRPDLFNLWGNNKITAHETDSQTVLLLLTLWSEIPKCTTFVDPLALKVKVHFNNTI